MKASRAAVARLVLSCENTLGWQPPAGEPLTKARARVTRQILRQLEEQPDLTLHDLKLAIELMRERRMTLFSPASLIHFVAEARDRGASTDVQGPLELQVQAAKRWELEHELPGYDDWLTRLVRARGDFRADVLDEWRTARAGELKRKPMTASAWA